MMNVVSLFFRVCQIRPCVRAGFLGLFVAWCGLATCAEKPSPASSQAADKSNASSGTESFGDSLATGKMELLEQEMTTGLKQRGAESDFLRLRSYLGSKLNSSAAAFTGSELTGNCRLRWYDRMLRNPLKAPVEAEKFTRDLYQNVLDGPEGLARLLATARSKLDLGERPPVKMVTATSAEQALEIIKTAIVNAQIAYSAALSTLTKSEIRELTDYSTSVLGTQNVVGHTLGDRNTGRRMCDLLEKVDRAAMFQAAEEISPLVDEKLWKQVATLPDSGNVKVPGTTGRILRRIETSAGDIVIGGRDKNTYRLDEMGDVACVIDLGGDDEYVDGVANINRPVLVVADLKGNDYYKATRSGVQGGAVLGVSMLLDFEGNDVYQAQDIAQGSSIGGVGFLIDYAGHDHYVGVRRVQGSAMGGLGILIDRGGNDDYRAAMWAQGFGGPLGFGLLDDISGDDHYYAGGTWRDSYPETPGYEGWSQGVGAGLRQVANGGFGVILDGSGDDVYEFDYLSHGGGYWCAMGFARDFGGNDKYIGSTIKMYNGSQRGEAQFQRFGCGWGCHYALGFMFDDTGNDYYRGSIMGMGFGWDCAVGVLCDFGGNDKYDAPGSTMQGVGAQASLGILFDYDGDDQYVGYGQGYASPSISYHTLPGCGGNFSFLIDYGGEDNYGSGAQNNSYVQRGSSGGFLIDRPRQQTTAEANPKSGEATAEKIPKAEGSTAGL